MEKPSTMNEQVIDPRFSLYHADCFDILPSIPDKSVDLICCDLPYGVTSHPEDIPLPLDKLWEQYERIIKDNGAILLFGQGMFYVDLVDSNRRLFRYDLVWDKVLTTGFLNAKKMPLRRHEQIAVFYKKLPTYNPQFSKATNCRTDVKKHRLYNDKTTTKNYDEKDARKVELKGGSLQRYPTSIITFQKPVPDMAEHRTEKSIELLKFLVKTYTNEGETVLDNCMGGGSCGIACMESGRRFIGIEKNTDYFEVAKDRIAHAHYKNESCYTEANLDAIFE